jgi:two-component system, NarL family, response regulator NreC
MEVPGTQGHWSPVLAGFSLYSKHKGAVIIGMIASGAVARSKVLIVDDNLLIRRTLTQLINQRQDLVVCGHASSVDEGAEIAIRLKPDLALVDLTLGSDDSLQLIRQLRERLPHTRILVLSMHEEDVFAFPVLRAGASGFVMKQKASQHLFEAIRAVLAGQVYVGNPRRELPGG